MEEDGLIIRKPDRLDRRKVWVFLTKPGLEKRAVARETVVRLNKRIFNQLGKAKRHTYAVLMQDINEILKTENSTDE